MELVKETEDKGNVTSLKISLIRMKNFSALALKHLQTIESEDLPNDADFNFAFADGVRIKCSFLV
jgi:hypothetical protein